MPKFQRAQVSVLVQRLNELPRLLQIVSGPRQSGKTTLVRQALSVLGDRAVYASADEPTLRGAGWLDAQWNAARLRVSKQGAAVLALDEVQKIPAWSETVKRLWDEDRASALPLHVIVLGSSPLLMQRGLTETLAGRFEVIRIGHWSFSEMRDAFQFDLPRFIFYGGYPGAAHLTSDTHRWSRYVIDSLIETTIARDVMLTARVDKPALLRQLFDLGCRYSGQILSFNKMLGQLQDAGNTTTLAHYLQLLEGSGMIAGVQKYAGGAVRSRGSIPKLQVMNTALMTATSGLTLEQNLAIPDRWGRVVESAVAAHLLAARDERIGVFYWRERGREIDFVVTLGSAVLGIEVKSGTGSTVRSGLDAFRAAFGSARLLIVGGDGIPLEDFLSTPVARWIEP